MAIVAMRHRRFGSACSKQGGSRSVRRKTMAAKRNWARPRRLQIVADLARRWCRFWTEAPRLFEKVVKSVRRLAFQKALSERIKAGDILTIDKFAVSEIKTKAFFDLLRKQRDRREGFDRFRLVRRHHLQIGAQREACETGDCGRCEHSAVARVSKNPGNVKGARKISRGCSPPTQEDARAE